METLAPKTKSATQNWREDWQCQAWRPEFNPLDPSGVGENWFPQAVPWHHTQTIAHVPLSCTHGHTNIKMLKKKNKTFNDWQFSWVMCQINTRNQTPLVGRGRYGEAKSACTWSSTASLAPASRIHKGAATCMKTCLTVRNSERHRIGVHPMVEVQPS